MVPTNTSDLGFGTAPSRLEIITIHAIRNRAHFCNGEIASNRSESRSEQVMLTANCAHLAVRTFEVGALPARNRISLPDCVRCRRDAASMCDSILWCPSVVGVTLKCRLNGARLMMSKCTRSKGLSPSDRNSRCAAGPCSQPCIYPPVVIRLSRAVRCLPATRRWRSIGKKITETQYRSSSRRHTARPRSTSPKQVRSQTFLNKCNQRQLMLNTNCLDEIVGSQQHASDRWIRNDVGNPENSHSIYSYGRPRLVERRQ